MRPFPFIGGEGSIKPFLEHVLAGEYDIAGVELSSPPVVLDIGANVGAYTWWALERWPGCTVWAYEPEQHNFEAFNANLIRHPDARNVHVERRAIVQCASATQVTLYQSQINGGMHSLIPGLAGEGCVPMQVPSLDASRLPIADVVKIDAEGIEGWLVVELLLRFSPLVISVEWHHEDLRKSITRVCEAAGYSLWSGNVFRANIGTFNFIKKPDSL